MPHYGGKWSITDFCWERCEDSVLANKNFMHFATRNLVWSVQSLQ